MLRVPKYSKETKSTIDYSRLAKDHSQLQIVKTFKHDGDVSKARAMKQDWKQIASILNTGEISLYNYDTSSEPVATLRGLDSEGFGLSWNPNQKGVIVAATGQTICLWDVNSLNAKGTASTKIEDAHTKVINDVKFSNLNPHLFGTASDDGHYKIWDFRSLKDGNTFVHCYQASEDDLLVLSFNHTNEHLFATGGEQSGMIQVWDLRMPRNYINDLIYHKGPVTQLEWSPHCENLLLSSGTDGQVYVWDNDNTGQEQARTDYADGPPEMIFPHEMHKKVNVEDICWGPESPGDDHMAVSIDTQMSMQVWKMSEDFFFNEIDFIDRLDLIREGDLE
jgi:histone-binding protein RBBP4